MKSTLVLFHIRKVHPKVCLESNRISWKTWICINEVLIWGCPGTNSFVFIEGKYPLIIITWMPVRFVCLFFRRQWHASFDSLYSFRERMWGELFYLHTRNCVMTYWLLKSFSRDRTRQARKGRIIHYLPARTLRNIQCVLKQTHLLKGFKEVLAPQICPLTAKDTLLTWQIKHQKNDWKITQ